VVHVLSSAEAHGTAQARIVSALGRAVDPDRYRLVAWFLTGGGPLEGGLAAAGVTTRALPFGGRTDPAGALRFVRALRADRPALVHLHVTGRTRTWLIRAGSSARRVEHFHGAHGEDGEELPLKRLARGADAVLATSAAVAEATGRDATVVYPGVEVPAETKPPRSSSPPKIGTVARLEPIKRIDLLLEATARLRSRHPELEVEIAGDGTCRPQLEELARSLGIADAVRFLGWTQEVQAVHRRWSAFAIPSSHEGLGVAALEAMASGLPVVGSATGGLPELIREGETGFLIPPGDADALADRVDRLLGDAARRRRMGAAGMERARRGFPAGRSSRLIEEAYNRLLGD
jgi:glycosyltransferase involved in cell wall biosynthesis